MSQNSNDPLASPKPPGIGDVISQLKRDLFGKDVENAATYTYGWLADQVGHFSLGFVGTLMLTWLVGSCLTPSLFTCGWFWAGAICLLFVGIETADFIWQLREYNASSKTFKFNGFEVLGNCFIAVYYIAIGAVVAAFGTQHPLCGVIAFLVGAVFFAVPAVGWLEQKIRFQQAGLPIYYRLAFFKNDITPDNAKFIADLSHPECGTPTPSTARHLIIAGPLSSGKSTLAAAIGTEFAVRGKQGIGRYMTFAKLVQTVVAEATGDDGVADEGRILWPWQTSDMLIVDDVDVITQHTTIDHPETIDEVSIAHSRANVIIKLIPPEIRDHLKYRRTIWVIGNVDDGQLDRWKQVIGNVIEIDYKTINVCKFKQPIHKLDKDRPRPEAAQRAKL